MDYVTEDGSAVRPCDYARRFGTLTFPPGETARTVLVPVVGDQAAEGDEQVALRLGNPAGATLGRDAATVRILDDDPGPNEPPLLESRAPADGAAAVASPPALTWSASDPDPGDALVYDVHLGTAFSRTGQQWLPVCAGGAEPGPRWGAVSGYDEASDRLIVYGGETPSGPAEPDLFVLVHASGTGGAAVLAAGAGRRRPGAAGLRRGRLRRGPEPPGRLRRLLRELRRAVRRDVGARGCERPRRRALLDAARRLGPGRPLRPRRRARPGRGPPLRVRRGVVRGRAGARRPVGPGGASGAGAPPWHALAADGDLPGARRDASARARPALGPAPALRRAGRGRRGVRRRRTCSRRPRPAGR